VLVLVSLTVQMLDCTEAPMPVLLLFLQVGLLGKQQV